VKHKANRRRGYTSREAAAEEEKDKIRQQKQRIREGELERREGQRWQAEMVEERRVAREEALAVYAAQVVARRQQDVTLPTPVSIATAARLPLPSTQLLSFVAIIARNDDLDIEFSSDEEETLSRDGYDGGVDFGDSRREDNIADDSLELLALDT
jgi:hypothetical protein